MGRVDKMMCASVIHFCPLFETLLKAVPALHLCCSTSSSSGSKRMSDARRT